MENLSVEHLKRTVRHQNKALQKRDEEIKYLTKLVLGLGAAFKETLEEKEQLRIVAKRNGGLAAQSRESLNDLKLGIIQSLLSNRKL